MAHFCFHWMKVASPSFFLIAGFLLTDVWAKGGWVLLWSDEFDGTSLNESVWTVEVHGAGAFNGEQQRYTAGHDQAASNIFVDNGCLSIVAKKSGDITSGRINSQGKKTFMHGRMEARMRLPVSMGMWPAFWMLGTAGGWPGCGELDIMEGKGRLPSWTSGSYHFTNFDVTASMTYPKGNLHDSFHLYAAEWTSDSMRWYCDDSNFTTLTKAKNANLPFDRQFYFILNLAVGGNFDGNSDATTIYPESLVVDYVRVYNWNPDVPVEPRGERPSCRMPSIACGAGTVSVSNFPGAYCSITITAMDGKTVVCRPAAVAPVNIDTRAYASGVYCVTASGVFGAISKRIVVSRR
jgi:beta-glucanase (GH16 family)